MNEGSVKKPRRSYKRQGKLSDGDKHLIEDVIAQTPGGLSTGQQHALAVVLRKSRDVVKRAIEDAHDNLAERAGRYADIHLQTTETALSNGDAKSLEVAARASQSAMENINVDGVGVVEKKPDKPVGNQVIVGIQLGGMQTPEVTVTEVSIEGAKVGA